MTESLKVNIGELQELSRSLKLHGIGLETELGFLASQVQQLLGAWGGDAQRAYDLAQESWLQSLESMRSLLNLIAESASEVAAEYDSTDKEIARKFV